jgi:hypothetical protein
MEWYNPDMFNVGGGKLSGRARFLVTAGLSAAVIIILLIWRSTNEGGLKPASSVLPLSEQSAPAGVSPLDVPTLPSAGLQTAVPATAVSAVNAATLEAIRTNRPTATIKEATGRRLPYVSPDTWRAWALRVLAAAGLLAYIGLRMRRRQ